MNGIISSIAMQQSSNVTSTSKISNESVKTATDEGQSTSTDTGVSSKYDTLELSQDYLTYKMQSENSTVADDTNLQNSMSNETEVTQKPMGPPPPPPTEEEDSEESESDLLTTITNDSSTTSDSSIVTESTSSSSDLSSYSESELKDMLNDGTITRAEYNTEIASREAGNDASERTGQLPPPPPPERNPENSSIGQIGNDDAGLGDSTPSEA